MKRLFALAYLASVGGFGIPAAVAAQELVISNARILVGNGSVIESGTLVVRGTLEPGGRADKR